MKVPKIKAPKMKLPKVRLFKLRWLNKADLEVVKNWDFVTVFCKVCIFCILYALVTGFSPDPIRGFLFDLVVMGFLGMMGAILIVTLGMVLFSGIGLMLDSNHY